MRLAGIHEVLKTVPLPQCQYKMEWPEEEEESKTCLEEELENWLEEEPET